MRIDLAIWTCNSQTALQRSLPSIEDSIGRESICHKIAIDAGSVDNTRGLLCKYGWAVHNATRKGIPHQANQALAMVDTPFFAAFEHDIILNPAWFRRTSAIINGSRKTGAVQGLRLYRGSRTMQDFEDWMYRAGHIPVWFFSIDNTLFRTEAVKQAGGFPREDPASADTILRRNMFRVGYRWITDYSLLSGHYRKDFPEQLRHQVKSSELARYSWTSSLRSTSVPGRLIALFGGNPLYALNMSLQSRRLRVPLGWFILRLQRGLYLVLPHEDKKFRPVPMDDWHLAKFINALTDSRISAGKATRVCAWCGENARFEYRLPRIWGDVSLALRGNERKLYACCDAHLANAATAVFKKSFDYIELEAE
jgi:hypothetical protein